MMERFCKNTTKNINSLKMFDMVLNAPVMLRKILKSVEMNAAKMLQKIVHLVNVDVAEEIPT